MFAGPTDWINDWIIDGARKLAMWPVGIALRLLTSTSTDPRFDPNGFFVAGSNGGGSPYGKVMYVALLLMVVFLAASVIGSIIRGEASLAIRSIALDMPLAIGLMVFAIAIVSQLVRITNEITEFFLSSSSEDLEGYLTHLAHEPSGGGWLLTFLIAFITFIAAMLLILILVLRMAFLYVVVAFMPLIFASMVWPSLRQSLRKGIEILLGLLFTKPAIALAIAVGSAALGSVINPATESQADFAVYCSGGQTSATCPAGSVPEIIFIQGQRRVHPARPLSSSQVDYWNKKFVGDPDNPNDGYPASASSAGITVDSKARLAVVDLFGLSGTAKSIQEGSLSIDETVAVAMVFDGRPCAAIASTTRSRSSCTLSTFTGNAVVVGDVVFNDNGDGQSTLIGIVGERANLAANSPGWRLVPVDQSRALLIPDLHSTDVAGTPANEATDVSRDELERGITVALDTAYMRQLTNGIPTGSGSTATTIAPAPGSPTTTSPATRASSPTLSRGDTQMLAFFNCTYAGAALDRTLPAFAKPRYDYEGCLQTQDGDADPLVANRLVVEDDGKVLFNRVPMGQVVDVADDGSDGSFMVQLAGAMLMLIAAFAPFLLLRLFPLLDLAVLSSAAEKPFSKAGAVGLNTGAVIDFPSQIGKLKNMFKTPASAGGTGGGGGGGGGGAGDPGTAAPAAGAADPDPAAGRRPLKLVPKPSGPPTGPAGGSPSSPSGPPTPSGSPTGPAAPPTPVLTSSEQFASVARQLGYNNPSDFANHLASLRPSPPPTPQSGPQRLAQGQTPLAPPLPSPSPSQVSSPLAPPSPSQFSAPVPPPPPPARPMSPRGNVWTTASNGNHRQSRIPRR